MLDSKKRFSTRAAFYVKYRPHYPNELINLISDECGMSLKWIIADIGCGTGISSELFVNNGNTVYGIEPNDEMRSFAETEYASYNNFISIKASAEDTTLDDSTVDMVISGQAFHWFDQIAAKKEFFRILKNGGWIVIFRNSRRTDSNPFMVDYQDIMRKFTRSEPENIRHGAGYNDLCEFFYPFTFRCLISSYTQSVDLEGLIGRTMSHSSMPEAGDKDYDKMIDEHKALFDRYKCDDLVHINYNTEINIGQIFK